MGIVDEDIARVRDATDIVAVISAHTQLKRSGRNWMGLCPFHGEKTPSFSVNAEEGFYHCFGCKESGDAITFVREVEHLDFVGAVESLANRAGITLRYTDANEGENRKRLTHLRGVMDRAVEWYHDRLLHAPDAGAARAYLRQRGFDRDMVTDFKVGWAPDGWDELVRALDIGRKDLEECGLGFVNRANRKQDFFRARILFPIFDDRGQAVAFGGRKLPDADGPKYQNSRENTLYHKSRTLYGLNWAKADIVSSGSVIICEGYTDVIGFFRADLPRAVATCGTALTEDHVRSLKRFTNHLVLAYDADDAGQAAAERVYEWEQRHEVQISVLALPEGSDPDELSRTDPQQLRDAVDNAVPFLGFRVARALAAGDYSTPEGRARVADRALDVVREHPSELVRDQYVMDIADRCRIDVQQLRGLLARPPTRRPAPQPRTTSSPRSEGGPAADDGRRRPPSTRRSTPVDPDADPFLVESTEWDDPAEWADGGESDRPVELRESPEHEALRLVVRDRDAALAVFEPFMFGGSAERQIFDLLVASDGIAAAVGAAPRHLAPAIARLGVEEPSAEINDVVTRLAVETARRAVATYEHRARLSDDPLSFAPIIGWLKLQVDALGGDVTEMTSRDELIGWLQQHAAEFA